MPPDTRSKPVHAIITSGGRSRRLAPLTDPTIHGRAVPKGILPLANIPAAEVMIGKLKQAGITEITFATAFMGSEIQRVLADGSRLGVHIEYRDDIGTDGPSGEMRAVANIAREQVRAGFNGRFLVVGSDILTSADFAEILSAHASNVTLVGEDSFPFVASNRLPVTMVVNAVPWAEVYRFGTVTTDEQGRVESFRQKDPDSPSNLNNSSIHVFEAAMFPVLGNLIERQLHTLPLFFQWLVANRNDALARRFPLFAYQHRGYWLDFGELEAYWRAQMDILDGKVPFSPAGTFIEKGQTVRIGRAKVIGPALVGDNVILGKKVLINPYTVIGEGYEIEARAQIGGSVLLSHPNLWPGFSGIVGQGSRIGNGIYFAASRQRVLFDGQVIVEEDSRMQPALLPLTARDRSRVRYIDMAGLKIEGLPGEVTSTYWPGRVWDRWEVEAHEEGNIPVHVGQREMTVERLRNLGEALHVVDLCCGTGKVSEGILGLPNVARVTSIDVNAESLAIATEKLTGHPALSKWTAVCGSAYEELDCLPLVDSVVCLDALHHLPDVRAALQKIHARLKEDGVFIGNFLAKEKVAKHVGTKRGYWRHQFLNARAEMLRMLKFITPLWSWAGRHGYVRIVLLKENEARDLLESLFVIEEMQSDDYHWFVARKK